LAFPPICWAHAGVGAIDVDGAGNVCDVEIAVGGATSMLAPRVCSLQIGGDSACLKRVLIGANDDAVAFGHDFQAASPIGLVGFSFCISANCLWSSTFLRLVDQSPHCAHIIEHCVNDGRSGFRQSDRNRIAAEISIPLSPIRGMRCRDYGDTSPGSHAQRDDEQDFTARKPGGDQLSLIANTATSTSSAAPADQDERRC
jgi:hypothetical protein